MGKKGEVLSVHWPNLPSGAGDKARQQDCRRHGPCLNLSRERKKAVRVNWSWSCFSKAPKISITLCLSLSSLLSTWQLNFYCCQMAWFLVALTETTGPEALTCLGSDSYRDGPQTV